MKTSVGLMLIFSILGIAQHNMSIRCNVVVPEEYQRTPWKRPPNGQPEPVRYRLAYEAFWWNCVAVRSADLDGRCPFGANGTPAASAGASDGALNADEQIDRLLKEHSRSSVQKYLSSMASRPEAKRKMRPYFERATPEVVD